MLLSICIPSYNRFPNLNQIVDSIVKAKSRDFEVLIYDNCSDKRINEAINCSDQRIRIIGREKGVDALLNCRTCIENGRGLYSMCILDKDFIDGNYLDAFLNILSFHKDVTGGMCSLNRNDEDNQYKIISNNNEKIKFYYNASHPTGFFYRKDVIETEINRVPNVYDRCSAMFNDQLLVRCGIMGKILIYNRPLVYSALNRTLKMYNKSYTYGGKYNRSVYFDPDGRVEQMYSNLNHASSLQLNHNHYLKVVRKIYLKTFFQVTIEYKRILKLNHICEHYGIESRDLSVSEMVSNVKLLNGKFINQNFFGISTNEKRIIIFSSTLFFVPVKLMKMILRKIVFYEDKRRGENTDVCLSRWNMDLINLE